MIKHKGIADSGKTLKQMLEENRRLLKETGCYAGITQPHLLKERSGQGGALPFPHDVLADSRP